MTLIIKLAAVLSTLFLTATSFAPRPVHLASRTNNLALHKTPFFASKQDQDSKSFDEEVEELVQEEMRKSAKYSKLSNERGVEYAPWMNMSPEDEAQIRIIMREKAEVRRRRKDQERDVRGALLQDSQWQELSGSGLRYKVLNGDSVELTWATDKEKSTEGFIIKRRPTKTEEFETLASYKTCGPLESKGPEGGVYRFLDENVEPGKLTT